MDFASVSGLTPLEIFRIIAAEFSQVPDEDVNKAILIAGVFLCPEEYGEYGNVALALMAAHIMALPGGVNGGRSTSSQKVTSMKEGDLSLTYGSVSDGDSSWLGGSTYGVLLTALQKRLGMHLSLMTRGPIAAPSDLMTWL